MQLRLRKYVDADGSFLVRCKEESKSFAIAVTHELDVRCTGYVRIPSHPTHRSSITCW